jgi:hypothetical protein
MLRALMTAYPWDLIDEGPRAVLDRLHGEVGITGLSLWVAAPPITQFRVRSVVPRVFRTRGGLFFHPSEEPYAGTRCKPVMSGSYKGRDPLARILESSAEYELELRALVSAARTGRLAQRHPEMACKNVFGIPSHHGVCLMNPDVQSYLCALVADLSTRYDLAGVTLADFSSTWDEAFGPDLQVAVPLDDTDRFLLGICFCESCHQKARAAGVDASAAARTVRVLLEERLMGEQPVDAAPAALLAAHEPLGAYFHWRTSELADLLRQAKEACRCELLLNRRLADSGSEQLEPLDLSIPDAVVFRLGSPEQLPPAMIPDVIRSELALSESWATGPHDAALVSTLTEASRRGFAGVEMYNYGLMTDSALTLIKQAIRFARRTATE